MRAAWTPKVVESIDSTWLDGGEIRIRWDLRLLFGSQSGGGWRSGLGRNLVTLLGSEPIVEHNDNDDDRDYDQDDTLGSEFLDEGLVGGGGGARSFVRQGGLH